MPMVLVLDALLGNKLQIIKSVLAILEDERAARYRITIGPNRGRDQLAIKRALMARVCAVQSHALDEFLGTTVVDLQRAGADT